MRVVIDTNIFVSSFFGGNPRKVVDLWKKGSVTLCLSKTILDEYVEVLQRIGLEDEKELAELLTLFAKGYNLVFTTKTPEIKVIKDDPADDKFVECAVALKTKMIITGDKALENLGEYLGIKVVSPQKFLEQFKEE